MPPRPGRYSNEMQISATIMRLVVILSVLVQIYADTVGEHTVPPVAVVLATASARTRPGLVPASSPGRTVTASDRPVTGEPATEPRRPATGQPETSGFRAERGVYRTKLSKLRLILLADMLNEIPPPQLELITCLANSSTLNVTTKHCDCEAYSCKDLLAGSTPSPFNVLQPKRKIHTSCREHCCRKKKFNRSIDPAVLENVVASSLTSSSSSPSSASASGVAASRQRLNTVSVASPVHRSPASASAGTPGSTPSSGPGIVREHRDRMPAGGRTSCSNDGIDQISISNNRTIIPWLYRVGLIETKHPLCAGALIHPSLILTTAVCVINKAPEELLAWNGAGSDGSVARVSRIVLPEQYATTFERLENNVALLVLDSLSPEDKQPRAVAPGRQYGLPDTPIPIGAGPLRAWPVRTRARRGEPTEAHRTAPTEGLPTWGRRYPPKTEEHFRALRTKRTPASICLSSIIERPPAERWAKEDPLPRCRTVSFGHRKLPEGNGRTTDARPPSPQPDDDGTNYVTTNISIFPATECRPEHREYLQHDGNLCAGFGAARNRSIDVEYSGSPLICDEMQRDGRVRRTVRGLLTWSTDINHAPHLFTNLTTYRPWIAREIERLEATVREPELRPLSPSGPIILRSAPYAQPRAPSVVLYG